MNRLDKRTWPRRFHDRLSKPLPSSIDWIFSVLEAPRNLRSRLRGEGQKVPSAPYRRETLARETTRITWAGHASFLIETHGIAILTDPVWSDRLAGGLRRLNAPGIPWEELPRIDAVVISHNHYDHLDWGTIRRLPRDTLFLVPGGLAPWFRKRGYGNVVEHDWWESTLVGEVRVEFVPAHHWSRRGLWDTNKTLWGGWVVTPFGGEATYFAGDTAYGPCFKQIGRRHPRIGAALLPVGAYAPRWYLRDVHTDPGEAVQAFQDLGARRMVPMHWGTFPLSHEPLLEPIELTRQAWAEAGQPRQALWDLALGESRVVETVVELPPLAATKAKGSRPARPRQALEPMKPVQALQRAPLRRAPT
jgi:L-ascorbate metabolism protein UlaG (beta-lactamase superfamily)